MKARIYSNTLVKVAERRKRGGGNQQHARGEHAESARNAVHATLAILTLLGKSIPLFFIFFFTHIHSTAAFIPTK